MTIYNWNNGFLSDYFQKATDIKRVRIISAYFSEYGLNLLKELVANNNLHKDNVEVCLSVEFTNRNAADILEALGHIAQVYIVLEPKLHAKAYLFEKLNGDLNFIHGSANFTKGGFDNNLEFVTLQQDSEVNYTVIKSFFDFCVNKGQYLTTALIEFYRQNEQIFKELEESQQHVRKKIKRFIQQDDLFAEEDHNLEDYYFNYSDYETFFPRNAVLKTSEMRQRRKKVQQKMLRIHKLLQRHMKDLDLHSHWNSNNVTSLIEPSYFNHHRVSWLGIRYGKTKYEVQELNRGLERSWNSTKDSYRNDEMMGFQKHACIQFSLTGKSLEIILFHAVAHGAVDRMRVWGFIDENNMEKLDEIQNEIAKLKGEGFIWYVIDANNDCLINKFDIDKDHASEFLDFYKKYDQMGYESYCAFSIEPNLEILRNEKKIAKLILKKTKKLLPLYNAMTFRISQRSGL